MDNTAVNRSARTRALPRILLILFLSLSLLFAFGGYAGAEEPNSAADAPDGISEARLDAGEEEENSEKEETEEEELPEEGEPAGEEEPEPQKTGIVREDGRIVFYQEDGTLFKDGFKEVTSEEGTEYYWFDADGTAFTGGYKSFTRDGKRVYYYFQEDGTAYTDGFLRFEIGGNPYDFFFLENGSAFTDGYKEVTVDGTRYYYYFLSNGQSYHSGYKTVSINGKKYYFYFDTNGRALINTQKAIPLGSRTAYFLFEADGKAYTGGYKEVKNGANTDYYYYLSNGQAFTTGYKTVAIGGTTYYYFFQTNGKAFTGGMKSVPFGTKAYTYCFGPNGRAYTNTSLVNNGVRFYFGANGRAREGLQAVEGKTYFFKDGVRQTGLVKSDGKFYYFNANYEMARSQLITIGHARYKFDANGVQTALTVSELGKTITGHHSFVYDYTNGILMYSDGNMYDTIYPASTTKLLTTAIALQIVDRNASVTLGNELDLTEPDASRAYLPVGGRITIKDLTAAVLVPSGSDGAWALAYQAGRVLTVGQKLDERQTVQAFLKEMNKRGKEMGLVHTNYTAPDGMPDYDKDGMPDDDHYTCMADQIKIACLAIADPTIDEVVRYPVYYGNVSGKSYEWWPTNPFLKTSRVYYDPCVTGLKSGTTTPAGACFMARVEYDGKTYLIGTFGSEKGTTGRYDDIVTLKDYFIYGK